MITASQSTPRVVHNGLVNHAPVRCAVCGQYVATFDGIPVILNDKARIIDFAHPDCCPAVG